MCQIKCYLHDYTRVFLGVYCIWCGFQVRHKTWDDIVTVFIIMVPFGFSVFRWIQSYVFPFFFFFFPQTSRVPGTTSNVVALFITVHVLKNIKNGFHDTIHTFKNYFATVLSVFSFSNNKFNPNGSYGFIRSLFYGFSLQGESVFHVNFCV